jgi:hypothetical protein
MVLSCLILSCNFIVLDLSRRVSSYAMCLLHVLSCLVVIVWSCLDAVFSMVLFTFVLSLFVKLSLSLPSLLCWHKEGRTRQKDQYPSGKRNKEINKTSCIATTLSLLVSAPPVPYLIFET